MAPKREPDNKSRPGGEDYLSLGDFFHKQHCYVPKPAYSYQTCTTDEQETTVCPHLLEHQRIHHQNRIKQSKHYKHDEQSNKVLTSIITQWANKQVHTT